MARQARRLTRARLYYLFRVDLVAGRLFWKNPSKYHPDLAGTEAGFARKSRNGKSYWIVKIDGLPHGRGHLIFLSARGRYPRPLLDHRDGNSLNDKPDNLRDATITQNAWNHKKHRRRIDLPMGVRINNSSGRYGARISFNGKQIHLGSFATAIAAQKAYLAKRHELYGEFA